MCIGLLGLADAKSHTQVPDRKGGRSHIHVWSLADGSYLCLYHLSDCLETIVAVSPDRRAGRRARLLRHAASLKELPEGAGPRDRRASDRNRLRRADRLGWPAWVRGAKRFVRRWRSWRRAPPCPARPP